MATQRSGRGAQAPGGVAVATFDELVQKEQTLKDEMQARLTEILPAVEEAEKIRAWLAEHTPGDNGATASAPAAPARQPRQSNGTRAKRGSRREQVLNIVRKHPDGVKAADVAKEMGVSPPYIYRLVGDLKKERMLADNPNGPGVVAA